MKVDKFFSKEDLENIKNAVKRAELKTSGEIVPYAVEKCDDYVYTYWRSALFFGIISGLAMIILNFISPDLLIINNSLYFFIILLGFTILGYIAPVFIPQYRRILAGQAAMNNFVGLKAKEAFLKEEVFKTRDRTGILIFISIFERIAIVIGDVGINSKVAQSDWDEVIKTIVGGIKNKKNGDALVKAIELCGDLLERDKVDRKADDTNELKDELRIG
ncbi:MAG: hypothetical protein KA885_00845 [Spirochaetes bacterium]|nr:hypothetical protein [Spirochaetota bacterium]